ncbi:MAG TPA: ABC transporter ATP-binding protein [Propionibacteriaceae bacterium]|nr:ABC transporter ATP-binding protein [Propionibacteriaceae bacterium]
MRQRLRAGFLGARGTTPPNPPASPAWQFFAALPRADRALAVAWWGLLVINGVLPAVFAVATGVMVGAVQRAEPLAGPLMLIGITFVGMLVVSPIQTAVSMNLGSKMSAWLNEALIRSCLDPPGVGHLEDADLADDLTTAREFDRGMTGPPMYLNVDFIATSLVGVIGGLASAVVLAGFTWWAPLVLVLAWGSTHWLLRDSGIWKDRNTPEVRLAQRHADYAYRLAVDPQPAKELRLFGLAGWAVERFVERRKRLFELQYSATRLRERSVGLCLLVVAAGNVAVFGALGFAATSGELPLDELVVYTQVALGVSLVAFGGLNWALDGAAAPVAAVARLGPAMAPLGALSPGSTSAAGRPARELAIRRLSFRYPGSDRPVFDGLDLTIPAGTSLAIVGQNGAGKTTLAKLLCRLYDPDSGAVQVDGHDLRSLDLADWRSRVTAVFQDFVRFELSLRENVDPAGRAREEDVRAALSDAGLEQITDLDIPLAKGYPGGTDLSGGQWQRVALARALCAVRGGAGLVLLDEPTAQLDVRGEAQVFDKVLAATRQATTILISHRFSTVRHADLICVLEHGRVVELGTHAELMDRRGRYQTMFDLQAKRFAATMDEEGAVFDVL